MIFFVELSKILFNSQKNKRLKNGSNEEKKTINLFYENAANFFCYLDLQVK